MSSWAIAVLTVYFLVLSILAIFGIHRYIILYIYLKNKNKISKPLSEFKNLPRVTVQLPVYNEMYVVRRLIDSVCQLKYPKNLLEIQVLDDSADATQKIAQERVEFYKNKGIDIQYFHREDRTGFKAGALEEGLKYAKGEFIAIFDADFIPTPNFLFETIHYFTDPQIGMVQARWGHINRNYSLLTQVQSILLDGHFVIEHTARDRTGKFFNFNGTAGIWRKKTIFSAGGWQHDTLTEDLDISYRAQIKGWRFIYLPQIVVPAELPIEMNAFKCQQHRWAKGSIQTAKKLLGKIFKAKLAFPIKLEAFFHLCDNVAYLMMIPLSLAIFPTVILRKNLGLYEMVIIDFPLIMLATGSVGAFYIYSQKEIYLDWPGRLKYLPFLMALGIGLAVNNAKAVLEALLDKKSAFERTPKFGIQDSKKKWKMKKYSGKRTYLAYIELFLGIYFTVTVVISIKEGIYLTLPFLLLFQIGYLYTSFFSFFQNKQIFNWALRKAENKS
ncbi:MAG: cellulose synthase family protein [Candidatus Aminicenantia bacterium]